MISREVFDANTWLRGFWCWYLSRIKIKRKRNPAVRSRNYNDFNDPQKDDDEVYDDDENLVEEIRNSNLQHLGGGNSRWVAGTTNKAGNWRVRAVGWWEEDVEQLFHSIHLTSGLVGSRLFQPKSQLNIVSKDLMGLFLGVRKITEYNLKLRSSDQKEYLKKPRGRKQLFCK